MQHIIFTLFSSATGEKKSNRNKKDSMKT